jgi:mannosyltransferase OCH1-like enzyme
MREKYIRFGEEWIEQNPGWQIVQWGEDDIAELLKNQKVGITDLVIDLYRRDDGRKGVELYVQLADVLGYVIVAEHGGVYVNCDMQPVQPFPELPSMAWASYENNEDGRIVNAAIGSPRAQDPFWTGLLDGLPGRYFANPYDEMVMTTGPGYLTDFANENPELLRVLPVETFNPVHWKQVERGSDAAYWADGIDWRGTPTIAVHHWGHKLDGRSNVIETATQ